MTGSIALDVVLGLIFIFLLYSLLASVIQEVISTFLGLRARTLSRALGRMFEEETKNPKNKFSAAGIELLRRLGRYSGSKKDGLLKEFYGHPGIKSLTSGLYYSKPSYISSKEFSRVLIDILKKKSITESTVLDKIKRTSKNESRSIPENLDNNLRTLYGASHGDLETFKIHLEEWFDHTMERVSGWYKRSVQSTLLVIGLFIAITFNVDTLEIAEILSKDESARMAMVELATTYAEENGDLLDAFKGGISNDSTNSHSALPLDFETKLDSLLSIKQRLDDDIHAANAVLGYKPKERLTISSGPISPLDTQTAKKHLQPHQRLISYKKKKPNNNSYVVSFSNSYLAQKTSKFYYLKKSTDKDVGQKPQTEFRELAFICHHFWGYLITALAISLGAPFWFDLLNKFIRIRTSLQNNPKKVEPNGNSQG